MLYSKMPFSNPDKCDVNIFFILNVTYFVYLLLHSIVTIPHRPIFAHLRVIYNLGQNPENRETQYLLPLQMTTKPTPLNHPHSCNSNSGIYMPIRALYKENWNLPCFCLHVWEETWLLGYISYYILLKAIDKTSPVLLRLWELVPWLWRKGVIMQGILSAVRGKVCAPELWLQGCLGWWPVGLCVMGNWFNWGESLQSPGEIQ